MKDAIDGANVVTFAESLERAKAKRENGDGRFYTNERGLFRRAFEDGKSDTFISSPIAVLAETRDGESSSWGVLLSWKDRDGKEHVEAFGREAATGDCAAIRSRLAAGGVRLAAGTAGRNAFGEWFASIVSDERARCVERIGWHEVGGGIVFVLPGATFGAAQERVVLQRESPEPDLFGMSGTVEEWRDAIGSICAGNSRLVLAASAAFAGPLLGLIGEDGGGFNLVGASRLGKSTALHVAGSILGGTLALGGGGYVRSWRSTGNALESIALSSCDATLLLDELGQLDPREAGDTAYMLSNGAGKARANRTGGARAIARWRLLFLSTGEKGLADLNAEAGRVTKAGQEARFVDVPADAGAGYGLFERLHHVDAPGDLAEYLREQASRFYGAPFQQFLTELVAWIGRDGQRAVRDELRERVAAITADYLRNWADASGQVRSVARRFAVVVVGGELATRWGITGWDDDTARELVRLCFQDWLRQRGTVGRREDEQAVAQLRDFLARHGEGRFERWVDPKAADVPQSEETAMPPGERFKTQNRAGWKRWVKLDDGSWGWQFLLTSEGMGEALNGLNKIAARKVLRDRGFLVPGKDGKSAGAHQPPGFRTIRLYEVKASIMGSDAGDGD
ncbi:DUF927 domain-containing protein [Brytella acorum]|uniref:DUF927 domain-containing protein n=1 Tax=Brytella acorum TaxID=2959299 RepID=A0AA35XWY1_9PROT|nr:DUF927 domain-containing protein [Brytella acorum]MDF3625715.1 DUF927 domain-containing protein [Brytella acorum]CAI9121344.1 DUF927 domain-containing protein [Brytella acorum]